MSSSAVLRGRIGAYRTHATHDPRETTANARAAFLATFYDEVDPNGDLPPAERERRAVAARKAYFSLLAYRSSIARSKKAARDEPKEAPAVTESASALEVSRAAARPTPTS